MEIGAYLSGYADGEGCFCVSFSRSKRHKFGWEIRPSFSVSQNRDRAEVLRLFKEKLGCGMIRPDRSDHTLKYEVRSVPNLVEKVIPHFEKYPLLSGKQQVFENFSKICQLMANGKHLTKEGFEQIVQFASNVNSGKRKFNRSEIKL